MSSTTSTSTIRSKSLRKSHSMPHISTASTLTSSSGYESLLTDTSRGGGGGCAGGSGAGVGGGSCSLLDQMGFCGAPGSPVQHSQQGGHHHHHQHHHNHRHQHPHHPHHLHSDNDQHRLRTTADTGAPHRHRSATDTAVPYRSHRAGCAAEHKSHHLAALDKAPYSVRLVADLRQLLTLRQHYYPEGGWGWVLVVVCFAVQSITHGLHLALGVFTVRLAHEFHTGFVAAAALTAASMAVGLGFSPVTVSLCKRKSTRLVAVIGGLVAALGCLFTSFALQLHQVVFSFAMLFGLGVNLTRDCSTVMVAQYFKKRRELVEVFVVAGSGAGVVVMTAFYQQAIGRLGWRLGLQAIAATVFATFILGLFYRSASLYHPQRRAILHLKNQRRKVKDKNKQSTRAPFFDARTLHSKTVRIILVSTAASSFGLYTPLFLLAHTATADGCTAASVLHMHAALGGAWMLGCVACGALVVRSSRECRIGRQYLCQMAACVAALAQLTLSANAAPSPESYVMFGAVYGGAAGAWHYALKVYTYERVRARNFARAWSYVQCAQALPIAVGVPLAAWLSENAGSKVGYVWGAVCTVLGAAVLFLVDVHKRSIQRQQLKMGIGSGGGGGDGEHKGDEDISVALRRSAKSSRQLIFRTGSTKDGGAPKQLRRLSFSNEPENDAPFPYSPIAGGHSMQAAAAAAAATHNAASASATATALMLNSELLLGHMSEELMPDLSSVAAAAAAAAAAADKAELTCISEEGIADMDLPDNLFDDYDYIGDCITSCNKVENYLMLSEFENNLNVELPSSIHSVPIRHAPCPNAMCHTNNV